MLDQLPAAAEAVIGPALIDRVADGLDHLHIGALGITADIVNLAGRAVAENRVDRIHVVKHIKPVANLLPVAVHRQGLHLQRIEHHQRNQLLGKLERAVVVRAIGGQRRQAIGMVEGAHQVVGTRLGGGIG